MQILYFPSSQNLIGLEFADCRSYIIESVNFEIIFPFFFERRGLITKKEVQLQSCETFSICFTLFFHHFMATSNTDPSSVILHCRSMLKIALPVQQPRQIYQQDGNVR